MHGSLGPGEQPNQPITVHMANGKDKVSFGFSGMQEKNGRVTALWKPFSTKNIIKVEQIAPYEWREVPEIKINGEYCWEHKSPDGGWTCAICREVGKEE